MAGTLTTEWLSSPGDSPRSPPAPAIYSTVANQALGYAVSWYSTTSLVYAKVRSVTNYWGQSVPYLPAPVALWVWGLVRFC